MLSAFAAYAVEKKLSKNPIPFGEGAIEGVAGPEPANNAGARTSFIPMLLGFIPGPMMVEYLRRALLMSSGDFAVFLTGR